MNLSGHGLQSLKGNAMMISRTQVAARSNTPDDIPLLPAVPTALLLDKRLMPLERNAWMVLHASANADGNVTGISYMQLRQFLACVPDNPQASRETVARTLTVLRLTRWIHIDAHVRNPLTGHLSTNHYAVHLGPLPIRTASELGLTWADLLEQSFAHASAAVRQIALSVLTEVVADSSLLRQMPIALRMRAQQLGLQTSHAPRICVY
ncbi:STY4528 family pathogenicity island replication protein [Kerstersia gyiorum]|uniref:STY4528 family pathogenicity island replication protein n=1 Tax=Kerstersia gyiorum TaxID=206506 RepID=UPI00083924CA|nr:STY4528 family pathogenicity island replication protein [Kerstersia gyiorum]